MSEEERPKVAWGTAELVSGFDGIVREARIGKSDKSFDDKEPADQLFLLIEPTSYVESDESKWPRHWYSIKYSKRSKWATLQEALEKCGALPKESEEELVGKEFHWERKELEFGLNRQSGEKLVSQALIPTKFIRNHKETKGAKAPASPSPAPVAPVAPPAPKPDDLDVESIVVEMAKKEPMDLEKLYKTLSKDHGVKRADAFKAIMALQKQGVVKLNKEENVLTVVE